MLEEDGSVSRAAKNALIGALVFAGLTVGYKGLQLLAQEEAKRAVTNTISQNTTRLAELKKLVIENQKLDDQIHPQVGELRQAISNLENQVDRLEDKVIELNSKLDRANQKVDELIKLLIESMK